MIPKSLQVFSSFNSTERSELKAFSQFNNPIQSNSLITVINVYADICEDKITSDLDALIKRKLPHRTYSQIRLLQSDLQKLMEKYILWKSIDQSQLSSQKKLLEYYKKRGLFNVHKKKLNSYKKELSKRNIYDLEYLEEELFIAEEAYEYAIQSRKEAVEETNDLVQKLDHHFILRKLKYSCMVRAQENVYNLEFDHGLERQILEYIEQRQLMTNPGIGTYYYCFKMLSAETIDKDFSNFFQNLTSYSAQFSFEENKLLYTLAINYCIRRLNQGRKEFGRRGLDLYQSSLENGVLLSNGRISKFTFRNIITISIRLEEFKLADSFIENYQELLEKKDQKNMVHFTTALIQFSKNEYEKASLELVNVQFKDLLFNLATKGLQLKIYYEQNEKLVLGSHLDAMQIFLKRHRSLGYHKQNYLNIIKYMRKLINAKSVEHLNRLETAIYGESNLTEKRWLSEKVKEKKMILQ